MPPAPLASPPMKGKGAIAPPLTGVKAPLPPYGANERGPVEPAAPSQPAAPGQPTIELRQPPVPSQPAAPSQLTIELGAPLDPGDEPLRVPLAMLRRGVLVAGSAGAGTTRTLHQLLGQATAAGIPWLIVDPDRSCGADGPFGAHGATVINPVDPDAVPVTVSLLAPAPGYPLHAHIALVGALFDVAFGADEALSLIVARALSPSTVDRWPSCMEFLAQLTRANANSGRVRRVV